MSKPWAVLLLLLPLSFSACSLDVLSTILSPDSEYGQILLLTLALGIAVLILAYYAGKFYRIPQLTLIFSSEASSFLSAVVFLSVSVALAVVLCSLSPVGDFSTYALEKLGEMEKNLQRALMETYSWGVEYARIASLQDLVLSLLDKSLLTYPKYPEAGVYSSGFFLISGNFMRLILSSLSVQRAVLLLSTSDVMLLLLVVGLIFRLIPFLKDVGSLILSVFVGFYLIYPFLYSTFLSIMDETLNYYNKNLCPSLPETFEEIPTLKCGTIYSPFAVATYVIFGSYIPVLILGITLEFVGRFNKIFDIEV